MCGRGTTCGIVTFCLITEFAEGASSFYCKVYFVPQFEALRERCGLSASYVSTLARCVKWDTRGGKSGSSFLLTQGLWGMVWLDGTVRHGRKNELT